MSDLENMQKYHDTFISSMMLLLYILSETGKPSVITNSKKLIGAINNKQLDVCKEGDIIKKFYVIVENNINLLQNKDSQLFNIKERKNNKNCTVTIVPAIDIGASWSMLNEESRENIWIYLKSMYINSVKMVNTANENINSDNNIITQFNEDIKNTDIITKFWECYPESTAINKNKREFDPYVGVGSANAEYGIDQILSGPEMLPEQTKPGPDGIVQMLGIDKMINMKELVDQLKNLSPDEIEKATTSIKGMFGDIDSDTSEMIDMMLNDISSELQKDTQNDNPLNNVINIAETVAKGLLPKLDPKKIDMNNIWNHAKNMTSKCNDKDGNPIFADNNNPISMLTGFVEKQMAMHKNNMESDNKDNMNIQTKEIQKMMKELGMPMISEDQLKNINFENILGDMDKLSGNKGGKNKKNNKLNLNK
jgi:hypothetical protein